VEAIMDIRGCDYRYATGPVKACRRGAQLALPAALCIPFNPELKPVHLTIVVSPRCSNKNLSGKVLSGVSMQASNQLLGCRRPLPASPRAACAAPCHHRELFPSPVAAALLLSCCSLTVHTPSSFLVSSRAATSRAASWWAASLLGPALKAHRCGALTSLT